MRGGTAKGEAIGPTFAFLLSQKSFLLVLSGFYLVSFTNYSISVWILRSWRVSIT